LMTPSPSTMWPSGGTQRSPRVQITAWHPSIARRQSSGDKALPSTTSTGPSDAARRASRVRTCVAMPRSLSRRTTNRPQPPVAPATRTFRECICLARPAQADPWLTAPPSGSRRRPG
jgi:hypothetical protein